MRASDLVGCRFRQRQRRAHPDVPELPEALIRQPQMDAARAAVFELLPVKRAVGDGAGKAFLRVDIDPAGDRINATREAFRRRAHLITNATLAGAVEGVDAEADVDILVRTDAGYMPVVISNHRVARAHPGEEMEMVPTGRLGLGKPLVVGAKPRHHTVDGYRVALAHLLLGERSDGRGAVIGQDRSRAYLCEPERYVEPLVRALLAPLPTEPKG